MDLCGGPLGLAPPRSTVAIAAHGYQRRLRSAAMPVSYRRSTDEAWRRAPRAPAPSVGQRF